MGSLGDKFKKLAGDQTRQLLQNFQNAQSSKTRNGYSYGKLNEDGTATLADGTVVQVEVKGRPGQYAPVFNLGNGQGLIDQPEAKFFNVDSNLKTPWILVANSREATIFNRNEFNQLYPTGYRPTVLYIANLYTGERFDIPISILPGIDGPTTSDVEFISSEYCCAYDFSLDMKHIVICSRSGDTLKSDFFIPPNINYVIIKNWNIQNGEFSYESLEYGTFSDFFDQAEPPGETFMSQPYPLYAQSYANTSFTDMSMQYIPILYTNSEGEPVLNFWTLINTTLGNFKYCYSNFFNTGSPDFNWVEVPKYGIAYGSRDQVLLFKDVTRGSSVTTIVNQAVTSSEFDTVTANVTTFNGSIQEYRFPVYVRTRPNPRITSYNGSFMNSEGELNHIVGIPDNKYNTPSVFSIEDRNPFFYAFSPNQLNTGGLSMVLNYGIVTSSGSVQGLEQSNTFVTGIDQTTYSVDNTLGFATLESVPPTPLLTYDSYIVTNLGDTYLRYRSLEPSLSAVSTLLRPVYQYLSLAFSSIKNISATDTIGYVGKNYAFGYSFLSSEDNTYFLNNGIGGSPPTIARQSSGVLVRLGPSRPSGQKFSGKVGILAFSVNGLMGDFALEEIGLDIEGAYKSFRTIPLNQYLDYPTDVLAGYTYAIGYR